VIKRLLLFSLFLFAVTAVHARRDIGFLRITPFLRMGTTYFNDTKNFQFDSGSTLSVPNSTALTTAECVAAAQAGRVFIDTNATSGQQFFVCEGATGWVLSGDGNSGGGGGGSSKWTDDSTNIYVTTITRNVIIGASANGQSVKLFLAGSFYSTGSFTVDGASITFNDILANSGATNLSTMTVVDGSATFAGGNVLVLKTLQANVIESTASSSDMTINVAQGGVATRTANLTIGGQTWGAGATNAGAIKIFGDGIVAGSVTITGGAFGGGGSGVGGDVIIGPGNSNGVTGNSLQLNAGDTVGNPGGGGNIVLNLPEGSNSAAGKVTFERDTSEIAKLEDDGTFSVLVGFDGIGAIDLDYGSGDITDHTFTTDSTGDAEIVLPNDSIGPAELDSTTGVYDFGAVTSFEIPNGVGPTVNATGEVAVDSNTYSNTMGTIVVYDGHQVLNVVVTTNTPADDQIPKFDSSTGKVRWEDDAGGGGSSEWTDTGSLLHPNETGDDIALGNTTLVNSSKLSVDGDADQVQMTIQGFSTQTDSIVIIEETGGAEVTTIDASGLISSLVGIDAIGAVDFDICSADCTDVTVVTDGGTVILDGVVTADGLTLGQDENITLGAQTIDHDGTDFRFTDTIHVQSADHPAIFHNTTDAVSNEVVHFVGNTRGTAADDDEGFLVFDLTDSAGNEQEFVRWVWEATDVTNGSEDGNIHIEVMHDGTLIDALEFHTTEAAQDTTIWNQGGENIDYRIEADNDPDMFFIDASVDTLTIGSKTSLAKFGVDGDQDEIQFLIQGNGTQTSSLVVFENSAGTDQLTLSNAGVLTLGTALAVGQGGIGATTLTDGGLLLGSGSGAITALGVASNGQIPIGDNSTDPVLATISATANETDITNGAGTITVGLADDITVSTIRASTKLLVGITTIPATIEFIVPVSAAGIAPTITDGFVGGVQTAETTTNLINYDFISLSSSTTHYGYFNYSPPLGWDESTATFKVVWTSTEGTGGVAWCLQAVALTNDEAIDTAYGTAVCVTDTLLATNDSHLTPASSALTIGNTPAEEDFVVWRLYRDVANGSDTLTGNGHVKELRISLTRDRYEDK